MSTEKFEFLDFSELEGQEYQKLVQLLDQQDGFELQDEVEIEKPAENDSPEVTIYSEYSKEFVSIDNDFAAADISFFVDGGSAEDAVHGVSPPTIPIEDSPEMMMPPSCMETEELICVNVYDNAPEVPPHQYMTQPQMIPQSMSNSAAPPMYGVSPQYSYPPHSGVAPVPNAMYTPQMTQHAPMVPPTIFVENCHVNFSPYGNPQGTPMYPSHYQPSQQMYQPYVVADQGGMPPVVPPTMKPPHEKMEYDQHKRHEHPMRGHNNFRGRVRGGRGRRRRDDHERSNSVSSDHSTYSDSGNKPVYKEMPPQAHQNPYHGYQAPSYPYHPHQFPYPMGQIPRHPSQGMPLMQHPPFMHDPYCNPTVLAYHAPPTPVTMAPPAMPPVAHDHQHNVNNNNTKEYEQYNQEQGTTIATHSTYISTSVVTQQNNASTSDYNEIENDQVTASNEELKFASEPINSQDFNEVEDEKPSMEISNEYNFMVEIEKVQEIREESTNAIKADEGVEMPQVIQNGSDVNNLVESVKELQIHEKPAKFEPVTEKEAVLNSINEQKSKEYSIDYGYSVGKDLQTTKIVHDTVATKNIIHSANEKVKTIISEEISSNVPIINTKYPRKRSRESPPIATFGEFSNIDEVSGLEDIEVKPKDVHIVNKKTSPPPPSLNSKPSKSSKSKEGGSNSVVTIKNVKLAEKPKGVFSQSVPEACEVKFENAAPVCPPAEASAWGNKKVWSQLFKPNDDSSSKQIAYVSPYNTQNDKESEEAALLTAEEEKAAQYTDSEAEKSKVGDKLVSFKPDYRPVTLQPRGLINKNYWCYVNAPLQALLACPSLYQLMQYLTGVAGYKSGNTSTPFINSIVDYCDDFSPLAPISKSKKEKNGASNAASKEKKEVEVAPGSPFEPTCVYKMLIKENQFVEGRQQDAEEMLSCVLNGLHDEMVEAMKLTKNCPSSHMTNGDSPLGSDQNEESEDEWKVQGPRKKSCVTRTAHFTTSPISQIFWGQLRSVLQHNGGNTTANLQPFNSLPLDIQSVDTLKDALSQSVTREEITGFNCPKTNQEVTASKQVMLEDLPRVLIIQLKRFIYEDGNLQKITKRLQFPIDLEITKDLISTNSKGKFTASQRKFKLFAIVNHEGKEATKGHYVADVFHTGHNSWVRYDDSTVKAIPEATVLRHEPPRVPYLLFYRRSDTLQSSSYNNNNSQSNSNKSKS